MIEPIHTANVNGKPVRFFRSHLDRPDFPWHSANDLSAGGKLSAGTRRSLLHGLFKDWRHDLKQAVVSGELTTLAPHFIGKLQAEIIDGFSPGFHRAYIKAATAAANVVMLGMPDAEQLAYMRAATRNGAGSK